MATTDLVTLDNTITYEGSGRSTLDGLIVSSIDRLDIMPDYKKYMSLLDYTDTTLISPDQKFGTASAGEALGNITETGIKNQHDFTFWPKKGVYQVEIWGKFTMSYLFSQWARKATNLKGATESIQAQQADVARQTRMLVNGYDKRYANEMVKLLTKGYSITASEWPGSATPKGLSLFNANHTYVWGTFSNLLTGAAYTSIAVGTTQLQAGIDLLKQTRDENGEFIEEAEVYRLLVSRAKYVFWKQVLNDNSNFSGQGTNANQLNQFNFKWNIVELVKVDRIWQLDENKIQIGTPEMFFIVNSDYIKKAQALKTYRLYSPRIKTWENDETDEFNTSIRAIVWVDHVWAELWIVGSTGI